MGRKRLDKKNILYTPDSGTTVFINYSESVKTLEVEYNGGKVYHYYSVEPEVWEEYKSIIDTGGSSGVFVNTKIKPKYKYREIT